MESLKQDSVGCTVEKLSPLHSPL